MSPAEAKERAQEAKEKGERLARAYAAVFGIPEARTPHQKLVWSDMEHRGYMHRSTIVAVDGATDDNRMACSEGQRIFVLNTKDFIERGSSLSNQKPKPKVIKK